MEGGWEGFQHLVWDAVWPRGFTPRQTRHAVLVDVLRVHRGHVLQPASRVPQEWIAPPSFIPGELMRPLRAHRRLLAFA
eukprot:959200-Prorocentrum_minimum.AAC.1